MKLPSTRKKKGQFRSIGMGKLGTILFEKDDGPASSLLSGSMDNIKVGDENYHSSSSLDVEKVLGEGKEMSGALTPKNTASPKSSLRNSTSKLTTQSSSRSVRFADDTNLNTEDNTGGDENAAPSTNDQNVLSLSSAASLGKSQVLARVMELQSTNKELKSQLDSEKKTRKKKEKNVLKVAQALNRRTEEIKKKDAQILKMAEYIAQSKAQVSAVEDQLKQIQHGQSAKDQKLQQEVIDANAQIKRLEAKLKVAETMDLSPIALRSSNRNNDKIHKALMDNIKVKKKALNISSTKEPKIDSVTSTTPSTEDAATSKTTTTAKDAVSAKTTTTTTTTASAEVAFNPLHILFVAVSILVLVIPMAIKFVSAFIVDIIQDTTKSLEMKWATSAQGTGRTEEKPSPSKTLGSDLIEM